MKEGCSLAKYEKVNSLYNASRIMKSFTHEHSIKRVTDISKELDLPKSTVSRLIRNLVAEGFLKKDKNSSRYMLGPSVFTLGGIYATSTLIFKEVTPVLTQIAYETEENVYISALKQYNVVYVNKSLGPYYADIISEIGSEQPAHLTSSGKVLLAAKNETYVDKMLEQSQLEDYSVEAIKQLKQDLAEIRERKYSINIGLLKEDNYSVAVPVYDGNGEVACSLTIIAPISRMSEVKTTKYLDILFEAAEEASDRLAFAI